MTALLEIDNVGKRFGGFVALDGINLSVKAGERLGLIGPNGSGKSTLVNCICGTLTNEMGTVRFDGATMNGLTAHERTPPGRPRPRARPPWPGAQLSIAAAIREPQRRREPDGAAALHRERPLRPASLRRRDRGAGGRAAVAGRPLEQRQPTAARPDAGRHAQA